LPPNAFCLLVWRLLSNSLKNNNQITIEFNGNHQEQLILTAPASSG
jgi:hypothetical protein